MISKQSRVTRQRIPYILRKGDLIRSRLFIIRFMANEESLDRFRTIVSKKIHSKAVDRNKLRRQIYEAIRNNSHKKSQKSFDFIFIPKKNILKKGYQEIDEDIRLILTNREKLN